MPMRLAAAILMLPALAAIAQQRVHVVREGDTLPRLVFLYGVDASQIQRANGLQSQTLTPGQRLVIPGTPPVSAAEAVPAVRAEPAPGQQPARATAPAPTPIQTDPPAAVPADPTPAARSARPAPTSIDTAPSASPAPASERGGSNAFAAAISLPASANVRYNDRWTPPGEKSAWVMDCSNTARWLHRTVNGIDLPRTASEQYEYLRTRRKLWRVRPDSRSLRKKLQPGDLLFWEHTYKPTRKPPVTHVMVYLGTDAAGRMKMAGSQTSSGPDIYTFTPEQKMGGYRFFLFFRREGRFVAYGRP